LDQRRDNDASAADLGTLKGLLKKRGNKEGVAYLSVQALGPQEIKERAKGLDDRPG